MDILNEQILRAKELMGIREDVDSTINLPNFKATDGLLSIDGKKYKVVKETLLKDFTITVHGIRTKDNGDVELDASASGYSRKYRKISKKNIDIVVKAVAEGASRIKVENESGTEFTLIKV